MENRSKYARFNSGLEMEIKLKKDGPEPGSNSRSVGEKGLFEIPEFHFQVLAFHQWLHFSNEMESFSK